MIPQYVGLSFRGKLCLLESNTLCVSRNKYAEFEIFILDEISVVSKKVCYKMHHRVIELFNLPKLPFADRSVLVAREFH